MLCMTNGLSAKHIYQLHAYKKILSRTPRKLRVTAPDIVWWIIGDENKSEGAATNEIISEKEWTSQGKYRDNQEGCASPNAGAETDS